MGRRTARCSIPSLILQAFRSVAAFASPPQRGSVCKPYAAWQRYEFKKLLHANTPLYPTLATYLGTKTLSTHPKIPSVFVQGSWR